MERDSIRFHLFLFSLLSICVLTNAADAAYISSAKAALKESPDFKATTLLNLGKGEEVEILEEKGFWRKIEARGQVGWISKLSLDEIGQFQKVIPLSLKKKKRSKRGIRTRVARAAVGVKGLRTSQIEQIEENYDMEALEVMESYSVDEARALDFLQVDERD